MYRIQNTELRHLGIVFGSTSNKVRGVSGVREGQGWAASGGDDTPQVWPKQAREPLALDCRESRRLRRRWSVKYQENSDEVPEGSAWQARLHTVDRRPTAPLGLDERGRAGVCVSCGSTRWLGENQNDVVEKPAIHASSALPLRLMDACCFTPSSRSQNPSMVVTSANSPRRCPHRSVSFPPMIDAAAEQGKVLTARQLGLECQLGNLARQGARVCPHARRPKLSDKQMAQAAAAGSILPSPKAPKVSRRLHPSSDSRGP